MHESPLSTFNNRDIWKKYNYRDLGIIGEPYFDIDFNKVAYYTDTGRMWDGNKYSVRDRVSTSLTLTNTHLNSLPLTNTHYHSPFPKYHSTQQIISALKNNSFPDKAMLTFHPQRWTDKPIPWTNELLAQGMKNIVKRWFFVSKK